MSWHIEGQTLERYLGGDVPEAAVFSIESHLLGCDACRDELATRADVARLERVWSAVADVVDTPRPRAAERLLIRCGVPEHRARLLASTPSLRPSWIVAVAVSLAFAILAARAVGGGDLPFLLAAPLVPVLGVAAAYGRTFDAAWEISVASPTGGFRLLLIRVAAVLGVSVVVTALAALALPEPGWSAVGWLLPSLALSLLTLALSATASSSVTAAAGVGAAWVVGALLAGELTSDPHAAFGSGGQVLFGAVAMVSAVAMVARRDAFERRGGR